MLRCSFCARDLVYVHGHAACLASDCPLRTLNQAECCTGETGCFLAVPRSPMADGSANRESGEMPAVAVSGEMDAVPLGPGSRMVSRAS